MVMKKAIRAGKLKKAVRRGSVGLKAGGVGASAAKRAVRRKSTNKKNK